MIQVRNLTQIYKSGKGIFEVSFDIKEGEVFGFLGPNGAGKTTTIRNIMGFSNASNGDVLIDGSNARTQTKKLQEKIGYLPGEMAFFDHMTGMEFLTFLGNMRRMKSWDRRDELIRLFELDPKGKIKKMSKGMKQKVGLVAAFMHDPDILILDEPTSGLDPFMQNVFMELIREEKEKGKTIMMSSHIFEEVQRSCDRAGIIRDGRLMAIEDIHSLKAMDKKRYRLTVADEASVARILQSSFDVERVDGMTLIVDQNGSYSDFFALLSQCEVTSFDTETRTLEDIFMKYYGEGTENE
ncbi:ABC transporter ATP-binding protein [Alkalibacter rhizosphaerae]|uniref:ABC transporter ATP-binding protein n=1 Tax=Alkalibacter rhizosphaerae TaxID=2815577 RepID=A0A975AIZ6_9FIRM|nr:ABC transporter ATP-binding protein [Alkalibacter rhizosphaerae]QSX09189.1 ABC transporter ATP-binding protein [Alkalibacter rhizosphaerae]